MRIDPDTLCFIDRHRTDDVRTLALQAGRYPGVDMPTAITQIAGWQVMRTKVPSWAARKDLLWPAHLPLGQCSSEVTARYKASLMARCPESQRTRLADLTGGLGIDCAFMAPLFAQATYVERQEALCHLARHNFEALGLTHIRVEQADCTDHLPQMDPADWIFLDPARRDRQGGKTVAMADCEPDVPALETTLLAKAPRVMVKLSPMLDLSLALHQLTHVAEAHVVSVAGECKELLLVLQAGDDTPEADDVPVTCALLPAASQEGDTVPRTFSFSRRTEQQAPCTYADRPGQWLYEPDAALLKAGAFRSLSYIYKVDKLHPNSHLYTSDHRVSDFPGRTFRVTAWGGLGKRDVKALLAGVRQANLCVRNFPSTVAELRKRLHLADGGAVYAFATTLADGQKSLILCQKP